MRKNCLLVGASGLLGSHLINELSEYSIYILTKDSSALPRLPSNCQVIRHDLTSLSLPTCLPSSVDAVIHLGQSSRFKEFPQGALDVFQVNTASTMLLLEYARTARARTFIYASSGSVYGNNAGNCREDVPLQVKQNEGLYYASKLSSELLVNTYKSFFHIVVLRYFFIYGPGQRQQMLIPRLVDSIRHAKSITLQGEDGLLINPIYVSDAAQATKAALSLEASATINIAGPEAVNLRAITTEIGSQLKVPPIYTVQPTNSSAQLIGSIERMSALLARPTVCFKEGICNYLRYDQPVLHA